MRRAVLAGRSVVLAAILALPLLATSGCAGLCCDQRITLSGITWNRGDRPGRFGKRPNGRPDRRLFYGSTPQEALAKLDEARRLYQSGTLPLPNKVTVAEWCERWLRETLLLRSRRQTGLAENTREAYPNALRYVTSAYGGMLLRDLTGRYLTELYTRMREQGRSLRQCQIVYKVAGQMLRAAVKERMIPRDVTQDVAIPPRPEPGEPKAMTPEKFARLLKVSTATRWAVAWLLTVDGLMGRSEPTSSRLVTGVG
ncbi:MAG: hypothetical protein AB1609_22525 [Bacillota bacterium]